MKKSLLVALKTGVAPLVLGTILSIGTAHAAEAPIAESPLVGSLPAETPAPTTNETTTIVVTGTLIKNPNLKSDAPITTVTAADLKTSGTTTVENLLNQMPQIFAAQSSGVSNGADGTSSVDLRGLGPKRTLVLINGRRTMAGDPTNSYADLNFIPVALIKSIDVLTGGASTTYGADAVAGVVNFVIDKGIEGFHITADNGFYQHNNSSHSVTSLLDARTNAGVAGYSYPTGSSLDGYGINATATYGTKFADGMGHFEAYVSFRHQNAVSEAKRDYSACAIASNGRSCGGSGTANPANGYFTPAGSTSSTVAAFGNGGLAVGTANLYNYAPTNYYMRNDKRWNAGMFADLQVSKAFHPYAEFMFMSDKTNAQIAPSGDFGNTLTINCNNPYLTASQASAICNSSNMVNGYTATGYPVTASAPASLQSLITTPANGNTAYLQLLWRNTIGAPRSDSLSHTNYRGVIGADGDINDAWNYSAYVEYGRTGYNETYNNDVSISRLTDALNAVSSGGNVVCASGNSGCSPLNLFSGTPSAASLAYITGVGNKTGFTGQINVSGQISGDLTGYGIKTPGRPRA
jgi:outer membrane receptor protein involved in Fe transport